MRILLLMLLALLPCWSAAQEAEKEQTAQAIRLAKIEAGLLKIQLDSKPLTLVEEPVLRWSNPISGQIFGDVYVWTLDGRPEAIASIYKWFSPHTHLGTELQSLSESGLQMTREGVTAWDTGPGMEMKPLTEVSDPHAQAFQRTRQMRSIAEQFKAKAEDRKDAGSSWFLRPLPKPIFRYQSQNRGIVDGAMYAYCQGNTNNPEVLLLLEAQQQPDGKTKWYYGLGRQNSLRFTVYRNDQLIWDVPKLAPPWPAVTLPGNPYLVIKTEPTG
ncbi:hypothetical protein NHH03_11225 [Stieleria sp. TO1_6]|uniref:hypothetical protein n=1 Tax=Stieleria tagensis TaxID=2956795 RepID=UPI00209AD8BF|nr:hypothetical protein [Stieleria tagensis]MCO8122312.1 hypothetical protein [Stieleria tagensis]